MKEIVDNIDHEFMESLERGDHLNEDFLSIEKKNGYHIIDEKKVMELVNKNKLSDEDTDYLLETALNILDNIEMHWDSIIYKLECKAKAREIDEVNKGIAEGKAKPLVFNDWK